MLLVSTSTTAFAKNDFRGFTSAHSPFSAVLRVSSALLVLLVTNNALNAFGGFCGFTWHGSVTVATISVFVTVLSSMVDDSSCATVDNSDLSFAGLSSSLHTVSSSTTISFSWIRTVTPTSAAGDTSVFKTSS